MHLPWKQCVGVATIISKRTVYFLPEHRTKKSFAWSLYKLFYLKIIYQLNEDRGNPLKLSSGTIFEKTHSEKNTILLVIPGAEDGTFRQKFFLLMSRLLK